VARRVLESICIIPRHRWGKAVRKGFEIPLGSLCESGVAVDVAFGLDWGDPDRKNDESQPNWEDVDDYYFGFRRDNEKFFSFPFPNMLLMQYELWGRPHHIRGKQYFCNTTKPDVVEIHSCWLTCWMCCIYHRDPRRRRWVLDNKNPAFERKQGGCSVDVVEEHTVLEHKLRSNSSCCDLRNDEAVWFFVHFEVSGFDTEGHHHSLHLMIKNVLLYPRFSSPDPQTIELI